MDWYSPTTKKHIKEAEAQGCKLISAGKSRKYRLYSLPCEHEQEVQLGHMRLGNFNCHACIARRLTQDAEAQGCKLLGPGRNANFRLYALPCGHDQEVPPTQMRKGIFRCRACLDEQLGMEAKAQGCMLLGAGKSGHYRLYKLPCGHEREIQTGDIRKGNYRCRVCAGERFTKESEAQGCKLLGPGKTKDHRLYLLPCGHEQQATLKGMRSGSFRCALCLNEKLTREAEARGCKLLGVSDKKSYCLYKLPCGHEQTAHTGQMRTGGVRCNICLVERIAQDAEAQGCKLLGPGRNANFRLYALPCGHDQEVQVIHMKRGRVQCRFCLDKRLKQEAEARGCELIDAPAKAGHRLYKLSCGHEREVRLTTMRDGSYRCNTCLENRITLDAKAQGCKVASKGRAVNFRKYELPCGHEQDVRFNDMRIGKFLCRTCVAEKHDQEAEAQACKILGKGKSSLSRLYSLPCGHEQEVFLSSMRDASFLCQTCEETSRTLPSNVYLLHIKVDSDEWLKLGYAKAVNTRVAQYGLPRDAEVTNIGSLPFDTGNCVASATTVPNDLIY